MNRKRILSNSVLLMALVGIMAALYPFIQSLKPSAKVDASLPRIDLSKINKGTYIIFRHPKRGEFYNGMYWSVFLLKTNAGEVKAWTVLTKNNTVIMPDINWWRPMYECHNFGPTIKNGKINESMPIQCHDKETPEWWAKHWQWNISGSNIIGMVVDLEPTRGVIKHGHLVLGKSS